MQLLTPGIGIAPGVDAMDRQLDAAAGGTLEIRRDVPDFVGRGAPRVDGSLRRRAGPMLEGNEKEGRARIGVCAGVLLEGPPWVGEQAKEDERQSAHGPPVRECLGQ
jgi:hypothetical protein